MMQMGEVKTMRMTPDGMNVAIFMIRTWASSKETETTKYYFQSLWAAIVTDDTKFATGPYT